VKAKELRLPPEFIQTIQNTYDADGKSWLNALPGLLTEACHRWDLTAVQLVDDLSYNFVAFATKSSCSRTFPRSGEDELVLKIGIPRNELGSEIAALRLYNGRGAVRLLDADTRKGLLLLERLRPGRMLSELKDDERATHIAADVMQSLWASWDAAKDHPAAKTAEKEFIRLEDWFGGFKRLRQRFKGGTGAIPEDLVFPAETLSKQLFFESKDKTLLHGDFHHYNVLESERGWLAIDPKGVMGPRGYEAGPFLINPHNRILDENASYAQAEKRIAILSERLGMERQHLCAWGFCHAILSAWWSVEDNTPGWERHSLHWGRILLKLLKKY